MDRRWAPAAAAAAVVVLVTGLALAVGSGGGARDAALPPFAAEPSATAEGSATSEPSPTNQPSPTREPSAEPEAAGDPSPSASTAPTAEPGASAPAASRDPSPSPTSPAPQPSRSAAPSPSPSAARAAFSFDTAYGTDEPYEVVVQYGDSGSCPHENVTHTVQETPDRVVVRLESDAMPPEQPCTADYQQRLVPVRLAAPLGERVVVDASRDEPVPVDRSCRRPFANPPPPQDCEP